MPSILVAGSLNADLVVRAPRFPQPGETIRGEELQVFPGGKGANQAVAAARLGAQVSMLGRVGRDNFGDFLLDNLQSNNVDTQLVQRDDASTGAAIIVVAADGQNSIVVSPGANGKVSAADVERASFSTLDLLLLQLEIPTPVVLRAAQLARQNGVRVILNPAPAQPLPDELVAIADFLIPNETELSLLTGMDVRDLSSAEAAAKRLLARGAQTIIVTLGSSGALLVDKHTCTHVDTFNVDVVDTTAAGDAFIGGFAVEFIRRSKGSLPPANALENAIYTRQIEQAVRYGCACGALACTKFGAQPSLPNRAEVEAFLSRR
ncbi:MAG: ribokinase [Chloroflexota bacterium]